MATISLELDFKTVNVVLTTSNGLQSETYDFPSSEDAEAALNEAARIIIDLCIPRNSNTRK